LADPDAVFVSNTVHDHVRDRLPILFEDLGEQQVKNITRPVRVHRVRPKSPTLALRLIAAGGEGVGQRDGGVTLMR
jgi:class 3 adenylate cyclase